MNLEDLVEYLGEQGLVQLGFRKNGAKPSVPLGFARRRPPALPNGVDTVLLVEPLTGTPIDHSMPNYYKAKFQAVVSTDSFVKGREIAEEILQALTLHGVQVSETMLVRQCLPEHEPVSFPKTEGDEVEHLVTFQIHYVKTS